MKFTINNKDLLKSIQYVAGVAKEKATVPILSNLLLQVSDNQLKITATDSDILISTSTSCEVEQEGSTTINANSLLNIVKKANDSIRFNLDDSIVNVSFKRSRYKLPCISAEEFVDFKDFSCDEIEIESNKLLNALNSVDFAVSNDVTRYYLTGINLISEGDKLTFTATDGNKLATTSVNKLGGDDVSIIIPKAAISEIRKIITGSLSYLSLSKSKIKVKSGNNVLISKLIDGEYPDFKKIIPQESDSFLEVDRVQTIDSLSRVSLISDDKHNSVKISCKSNSLILETKNLQGGLGHEEVDLLNSIEHLSIGFNSKFLIDVLNKVNSKEVKIFIKDSNSPALIKDSYNTFVIMPVRI